MSQAFMPVAAYNYGAKLYRRVVQSTWQALTISLAICYFASAIIIILSEPIVQLFNDDPVFVTVASRGTRIVHILGPFFSFSLIGPGLFQAVGDARRGLIVASSRFLLFIIPLALILPRFFGLDGIWFSPLAGELLAASFVTSLVFPRLKRLWHMES
jgi:Na+-driven multidrug efflux pump